jgi:ABC-type amino acid transport substrate-binding protein
MVRGWLLFLVVCLLPVGSGVGASRASENATVRVLVLDDAPPMSYRDAAGQLTGFSVEIARALCREIRATCLFEVKALDLAVESVAQGRADMAAVGLFDRPEQVGKLLLSKPYYRSLSLWLAPLDVEPGAFGVRVAVVAGSAQERYARSRGWAIQSVRSAGAVREALFAGTAQAALVPMEGALDMQKSKTFRRLGLIPTVFSSAELSGDATLGISPLRPGLRDEIDGALERIKRNGTYDRINSRFLPFRVS